MMIVGSLAVSTIVPVVVVGVIGIVVLVVLLSQRSSRSMNAAMAHLVTDPSTEDERRSAFPSEGLLVAEAVLEAAGSTSDSVWDVLEASAVPIAIEYYPVSDIEMARYRSVPVNAAAQQAMTGILEALDPRQPTLFRVVLPKGAELVKAVGTDGFRGFSRTGGQTSQAVLKPVAAGGALAVGWPVVAVAATVMAVDMVAQREQRAHQRRVEASLGRQEERHYIERIKDQRSADAQLSRVISLLLDGRDPNIELALKSADDEFHRSNQFLEKYSVVLDRVVDDDGMADLHRLDEALGGKTKEVDHFIGELHLARSALALRRKALIADAAAVALADPGNPYLTMQRFLDSQVRQLEEADRATAALTERLTQVELKGRWHTRAKKVTERQAWIREQVRPPGAGDSVEVLYLASPSGELLQLLPPEDGESCPPPSED